MKDTLALACLTLLIGLYGCTSDKFSIHGTVDPIFNDATVILKSYSDMDSVVYTDSTVIKDGKFNFKGKETLQGFSEITARNDSGYRYTQFFIERGDIYLELGKDEYQSNVHGTPFNDIYQSFLDSSSYYITEVNKHDVRKGGAFVIMGGTEAAKIWHDYGEYCRDFTRDNIGNIVGKSDFLSAVDRGAIGYYRSVNKLSFYEMYDFLDSAMLNHPKVLKYLEDEQNRLKKAQEQTLIGFQYTDFELYTPDDGIKRLSDYVGKHEFVYLDFWASWCGPCIADLPHLKGIYERYHDKGLEVIGITLDKNKTDWIGAIERHDIPWPNLWNPENISVIQKTYESGGVPYGVLIDKTGKVLSAETGSGLLEMRLEMYLSK